MPPESRALSNTTRGRRTRKTRTGRQNHWDGRHRRYEEQGPKDSDRASPELRVGGIDFNPSPDAHDRLRRLFALPVRYAARDRRLPLRTDPSPDDGGEAEG